MSGKEVLAFAALAVLLMAAAASSAGNAQKSDVLQQLLTKTEKVRMLRGKQQPESQPSLAREERRAQLSGDEREIMTKQIMQAISGMLLSELTSPHSASGRLWWFWGFRLNTVSSLVTHV